MFPLCPRCGAVGRGRKSISHGDALSCMAGGCTLRLVVDHGGMACAAPGVHSRGTPPHCDRFRVGDSQACVLQLQLLFLGQPEGSPSMSCHSSDQKRTERHLPLPQSKDSSLFLPPKRRAWLTFTHMYTYFSDYASSVFAHRTFANIV